MFDKIQNQTKTTGNSKIDCAKECPCGVPAIPVPDQWLEVMVTGGFKVWHIIFIIIAFAVTLIVVYCCFHRCRIPRTKQEIEADLMRSNITSKFRDYLQDLPNEPTSFLEALKKVQELEEKSEKDDAEMARDAGARKRLGWLKLKGKGDKEGPAKAANNMENGLGGGDVGDGGEQLPPKEKPLVSNAEGEPKKTVIPEVPAAPVATQPPPPPELPTTISPLDPNQDANLPKGSGEQDTKIRQPRRRKQKPNLSRTKRARENLGNGDATKPNPKSPDMDPLPDQRLAAAAAPSPTPPPVRPVERSTTERPPPGRHPPKQHTHHRVRIEPKIGSRPPDA